MKPSDKKDRPPKKRAQANGNFQSLEEFRREHIEHALHVAGNDAVKAAEMLGIPVGGLRRWMHKLEIHLGSEDRPGEEE